MRPPTEEKDSPGGSGQRSDRSRATNRAIAALADIDLRTLTPAQAAATYKISPPLTERISEENLYSVEI